MGRRPRKKKTLPKISFCTMQSPFQCRRPNVGWRCSQKLVWRRSTSLEGSPFLSSGWSSIEKVNGVNYCYDCRLTPTFKLDAVWEHPWQENPHNSSRGGRHLGEMVRFCKEELDIESVTVVTNGSKVEKEKTNVQFSSQQNSFFILKGYQAVDAGLRLLLGHPSCLLWLFHCWGFS